jgi:hypothetical protein
MSEEKHPEENLIPMPDFEDDYGNSFTGCSFVVKEGETFKMPHPVRISMPQEPPVGSVLEGGDTFGKYMVERDSRGWFLHSSNADEHLDWHSAFRFWGPGTRDNLPFTVVRWGHDE